MRENTLILSYPEKSEIRKSGDNKGDNTSSSLSHHSVKIGYHHLFAGVGAALISLYAVAVESSTPRVVEPFPVFQAKILARQEALAREIEGMIGPDTKVTIYAVEPLPERNWKAKGLKNGSEIFRDRRVKGFALLNSPADIKRLIAATVADIRSATTMEVMMCFDPHHGLTIERAGHKIDLLICFMCRQGLAYGTSSTDNFELTGKAAKTYSEIFKAYIKEADKPDTPIPTTPDAEEPNEASLIKVAFARSSVVFTGQVISRREVTKNVDGYAVKTAALRFAVSQTYKGTAGKEIEVECDNHEGYDVKGWYLIYGEGPPPQFVESSGRSTPVFEAETKENGLSELDVLEKLREAK